MRLDDFFGTQLPVSREATDCTPKGRLTQHEAALAEQPWREVRGSLCVKPLPHEDEFYVRAESQPRAACVAEN